MPVPRLTDAQRPGAYTLTMFRRISRRSLRAAALYLALVALAPLPTGAPAVAQEPVRPPYGVAVGWSGPDFTMLDLGGRPVTLAALRGGPVLVNFWATWCPPCVEELPLLDQAASELSGRITVVLLNVGEPHHVVAPFLDELGVVAPVVLRDAREDERPLAAGVVPSRSVAQAYQTFGLPTTLLLDAAGVIRARVSGPLDEPALRSLLASVGVRW